MARPCVMCGCALHPSEPSYVRYCKPCYRKMKQAEQEELTHEIDALRRENMTLRDQVRRASSSPKEQISEQMVRLLLQLCHPDKHNGSAASTKATTWLLEQKGRR